MSNMKTKPSKYSHSRGCCQKKVLGHDDITYNIFIIYVTLLIMYVTWPRLGIIVDLMEVEVLELSLALAGSLWI